MAKSLTLMAVHAHPDDESSGTGGMLAKYSAEGVNTVLVTCTRGEYGDGPDHVKPGEAGHDPGEVARTRMRELDLACGHLGVRHLEALGYHDSGMADWPYKEDPGSFCNVPLATVAARIAGLFERYRPDVVVTYHDYGGYNHPDHLHAHRATLEAVGVAPSFRPAKLYFVARRRRDWERVREQLVAAGIEPPDTPARQSTPEARERMERIEAMITTTIDTSRFAEAKRAALAAHASQLDRSMWVRTPPEIFADVFCTETFIRHLDITGAPLPEDDVFAGLRA